jgi:putative endonuclease
VAVAQLVELQIVVLAVAGSSPVGHPSSSNELSRLTGHPISWQRLTLQYMQKYYVYILYSLIDKKFYIGSTADLKKRFSQHINGHVKSTQHRQDLKLIHYEYFINKTDALAREKFLKSGYGHEQLRAFLKRTLLSLEAHSSPPQPTSCPFPRSAPFGRVYLRS